MEKNFFELSVLLLNKPLHLCIIGLFCIIWGCVRQDSSYTFVGILLVIIPVCSWGVRRYRKYKAQQEQEDFGQQVIANYESLPKYERLIIDLCLKNNYRTFKYFTPKYLFHTEEIRHDIDEKYRYAIISLRDQKWGIVSHNPDIFTIHQKIFDVLANYKKTKF